MYEPVYRITNHILKHIGIIDACREIILHAPLVPAWERKFQEDAIVRQAHHGTHLEGNELNLSEAAQVVAGQTVVGRPRDIQEVINYRNVIEYIESLVHDPESSKDISTNPSISLTQDTMLTIHRHTTERILPPDKIGSFRTTQVVIKNSETGEVSFRPPAAVEVPFLIKDFMSWINHRIQDTHPVLASGIVQYEIARIHPFIDGNGRVARALATLVLYQGGYDIRRFFSLEEYYDSHAKGYYDALQSVGRNNGDMTVWLEYFVEGLAIELNRIKEKINRLSADIQLKEQMGGKQLFLSERQIKIIEHARSLGYIQNKMFSQLFPMVSEDTILRELHDLIKNGILLKKGKTKGAKYVLKS